MGWTQAENEQWVAPEIVGGLSEMLVEDGSNVNFTCRAAYPVTWCTEKNFASEHHQELYEEGQPKPYVAILTIDPVNYLHVGYYTCLYNTTTNRLKKTCDIKDPQISSIYLYVQDLSHLLVSEAYGFFFPLTVNEPFVIPCKPTFPDVEVSLEKIQTNEEYDPREGFKKYFTHEDTDICLAKYLNLTEQAATNLCTKTLTKN
ncbi:Platelet-derived growth factor receptor alpha-like 2 [Homarus americanus]|uniref:Platelet-derived growth factor receptor-like protein n=1 Tax=Homarus americanus TaxID=6706 RepID=A0A8J5JGV5_HOMAM|nr:Platelet-derived growth factor receptor alpha-like 2 [Homarus americanus]